MHQRARHLTTKLALSFILSVVAEPSLADEVHCLETDTPRECVRRLQTEREAAVQAAVAAVNSGAGSVSSPARSALKDFLSVAAAHLDGSVLEDRGQSLAFTYNVPIRLRETRHQVQVETVFATPQISNAAAASAGTTAPTLVSTLSNADDVRSALSFNPATRRLGRGIAPHRELFETLLLPLLMPATGEELGGIAWTSFDLPFNGIVADPATRAAVISGFETSARNALPPAADKLAADFATLLSNQPQLYATGVVHYRNPIIGPRVWQAMVTWEIGSHNLNGFYARDGKRCAGARACVDAFQRYVQRTPTALSRGRLALSLAYNSVLASAPDIVNPYVTPSATGLVYTAAYGLPFASFVRGREGRLDFTLTYDGTEIRPDVVSTSPFSRIAVSGVEGPRPQSLAPPRDRLVVAGTYTQRLSERMTVPISFVWSDHSESLPGACATSDASPPILLCAPPVTTTERPLVIRVGLTYKIPPRAPERSSARPCSCCCPER